MWTLREYAIVLFLVWVSIDGLVVSRRKSANSEKRDHFSFQLLMFCGLTAYIAGVYIAYTPYGHILPRVPIQIMGFIIMGIGIFIRTLAIIQLGRFHTPKVAVLADHRVVSIGLYRYVRHPSYLGALIAYLGWSLALDNWLSLMIIMTLTTVAYLYRIHEEEAALCDALGDAYANYQHRTKRLIPGIF
ncbi:MAG: isoprenylcysteine carboxylmethyltransferase family protein [Gammaproteobacteria bacterium]|nr:isoprenylcysteine carboxylmethyltransferase family protein [Gammaproteobacteria bacterium]